MKPEIGQIWKEVDPRFVRFILIVDANDEDWYVRGCTPDGEFMPRSSIRPVQYKRFNGKRGGYKFVKVKI